MLSIALSRYNSKQFTQSYSQYVVFEINSLRKLI